MIDVIKDHYAMVCFRRGSAALMSRWMSGLTSSAQVSCPSPASHIDCQWRQGKGCDVAHLSCGGEGPSKAPEWSVGFSNKVVAAEQRGYNKMVDLLLDMTEPIHRKGKVVTGDSGFYVTWGVMALHTHGLFGQFLIKKRQYWPQQVPSDQINEYMKGKELGAVESFVQDLGGVPFYIHCCRDADYITKIMLTNGTLDEVEGHSTWQCIDNKGKHWVDDVNNRCHDPIGLETTWKTKWWPNRQITFLMLIAEVNAGQAHACARDKKPDPTLSF
jgi:hypothetical protein